MARNQGIYTHGGIVEGGDGLGARRQDYGDPVRRRTTAMHLLDREGG
jgi:hypothetical protein